MAPIVQELRELASVADGRFTANLKEQNIKMPRIVLSPHEKPQVIALMTEAVTLEHGRELSKQFGGLVETAPNPDDNNNDEAVYDKVETKKRRIKKKVEFSQNDQAMIFGLDGGITQKTIRMKPDNERLGVALIWGLQTGLQEAGIYVKTIVSAGVAQKAGLLVGDRIVSVNMTSVINMDYQNAINVIKSAGKEFSLNIIRPKTVNF